MGQAAKFECNFHAPSSFSAVGRARDVSGSGAIPIALSL